MFSISFKISIREKIYKYVAWENKVSVCKAKLKCTWQQKMWKYKLYNLRKSAVIYCGAINPYNQQLVLLIH